MTDRTEAEIRNAAPPSRGIDMIDNKQTVLTGLLDCCRAWEPSVRILGNVRAGDAAAAIESALSMLRAAPQASAPAPSLPKGWQLAMNLCIDAIENAPPQGEEWPVNWPVIHHGLVQLRDALLGGAAPQAGASGHTLKSAPAAQAPAKGADVALPPLPDLQFKMFYRSEVLAELDAYARAAVLADRQQRGGDASEWIALKAIAEYPTPGEGSMSAANMREIARAALASSNAGSTEKLLRFCPSCGMLGDLPAGSSYLACCPDHGDARMVPAKFARQCKQLFSDALAATKGESNG